MTEPSPDDLNKAWLTTLRQAPERQRTTTGFNRSTRRLRLAITIPATEVEQADAFRRACKIRDRAYSDHLFSLMALADECRAIASSNDDVAAILAKLDLEAITA